MVILILVCSTSAFTQAEIVPIAIGSELPQSDLKVNLIDGRVTSLAELKAENGIIVIFSSITCPFVVGGDNYPGWEKEYNALYTLAQENGVMLVLVNANEAKREDGESVADLVKRAKDQAYLMPTIVDEESKIANAFGAKTTPHVFYFDGARTLVYEGSIDNAWDAKRKADETYLSNAIKAAAQGNSIEPSKTPAKGCSVKRK